MYGCDFCNLKRFKKPMCFHSPKYPNIHSFHTWMLNTDTEIYSPNKGIWKGPQIFSLHAKAALCQLFTQMPDSGFLNFKTRCHTFISVSLTLWCLSLLPGDTSLPCAYWMNTNVLIKPWWRSTLQSSLKICTKIEGGEKEGRTLQVCQKKKHVTVKGVFRETAFLLKSPQMKSALISPPLTWVFWEVKGQ